jgi:hypothetical protein
VSTRRYSSNATADPVGLDASPGGWKWAPTDATPSVRCNVARLYVATRYNRGYPARCVATLRACTLQHATIEGILRVQVVFDLQTLFRLSGVVTQARVARVPPEYPWSTPRVPLEYPMSAP